MLPNLAIRASRGRSVSPGLPSPAKTSQPPKAAAPTTTTTNGHESHQPGVYDIVFPRVFEDAWGTGSLDSRTDMERARIFLVRFATMSGDPQLTLSLRSLAADQAHRTIADLADAIKLCFFGTRHQSFAATPLLQAVRFIMIKGQVPQTASGNIHGASHIMSQADRAQARALVDFFFDPVLERTSRPPPAGGSRYHYPAARLKVAIVGGGPTALASAISLAEKGRGRVEVHLWERRWVQTTTPDGRPWIDYPPTAKRRDQVVTLQESVTRLLSPGSRQALFEGRPEAVWPGSANIQIRKVEDRFLRRCQSNEFAGLIHLHAQAVTRDDLNSGLLGDFHVLLGADGAASWVRTTYFHGYEHERGRSYALGLAFDRPAGLPWSQPLNVFLTLGQTRYLLNASHFDGRGYLNMQLTEEEWHRMVALDGEPVTFGHPGCLRRPDGSVPDGFTEGQVFAPSEDRDSSLWKSIADGLKLFGFKESEVINVVRIPIVVQAVKEGVQYLPQQETASINRPHALVAVAGDAAMTVHFWPGRGLNSGIKSGIALGDEIVHALNIGKFIGLPLDAMSQYNDFIMKLQNREHDKRSIPILNQSGSPEMLGWLLDKANSVPDEVAIEWLVGAMSQIAQRLELRPDWAFAPVANVEPQLRIVLRGLDSLTLRQMAVSFPWPTREMGGAEVLPLRSMKPEEKQRWLTSLWQALREERKKEKRPSRPNPPDGQEAKAARFEAPRQSGSRPRSLLAPSRPKPQISTPPLSPPMNIPTPAARSLRRSNATRSVQLSDPPVNLSPPSDDDYAEAWYRQSPSRPVSAYEQSLDVPDGRWQTMSPSLGPPPSEDIGLGRMLTVHRRPKGQMLSEALSLALFRVESLDQ